MTNKPEERLLAKHCEKGLLFLRSYPEADYWLPQYAPHYTVEDEPEMGIFDLTEFDWVHPLLPI